MKVSAWRRVLVVGILILLAVVIDRIPRTQAQTATLHATIVAVHGYVLYNAVDGVVMLLFRRRRVRKHIAMHEHHHHYRPRKGTKS